MFFRFYPRISPGLSPGPEISNACIAVLHYRTIGSCRKTGYFV